MATVFQIILNGILISPILTALGISLVYSTTKIFHLAHGVIIVGAAYAFWWSWQELGWNLALAVLFALAVSGGAAYLMNEGVYEKLRTRDAKGLGYLVATLALLMFGVGFILFLFGAAPKTSPIQFETLVFFDVYLTTLQLADTGIVLVLSILFFWIMGYTKLGKAMRATAENAEVAEVLGIDTRSVRRIAFLLSAVLATAAGTILVLRDAVDPNAAVLFAVRGFTATVIGGVGSLVGTILGALLLGVGEQVVVWFFGSGWRDAATFIILFFFLLLRPQGILGTRRGF